MENDHVIGFFLGNNARGWNKKGTLGEEKWTGVGAGRGRCRGAIKKLPTLKQKQCLKKTCNFRGCLQGALASG